MEVITNFRIPFSKAVEYVQAYVRRFNLDEEPSNVMNAIGGTLKIDVLKKQIDYILEQRKLDPNKANVGRSYQGLMCWFAWSSIPDNEHVYLAFEANDDVDLDGPTKPDNIRLQRPFDIIVYDASRDSDIASMLKRNRPPMHQFPDIIMRDGQLKTAIKDFQRNIEDKEQSNAERPYGLFENEFTLDVADFLNVKDLKYIRYYFGYDESKTHNKIRVILFCVNEEGDNLIPSDEPDVNNLLKYGANLKAPMILQKSWPPPNSSI